MILGISASGVRDGNLDRLVRRVLERTGEETRFIRLAEMTIRPCTGCVGCARDNRCVQNDDGNRLLEAVLEAKAVVWGAACYFGVPNAFAATALERLYPLRHREMLTAGKAAAAVVVGGGMGIDETAKQMEAMLGRYMQFSFVGSVSWASQVPPCFVCGFARTCAHGMPAMMAGGLANLADFQVTPEMFRRWEDDPGVLPAVEKVAAALRTGGRAYF